MKELGITAEHFFKVAKDIGCSSSILGLIWSKAEILRIQASVFRKLGDFQFAASFAREMDHAQSGGNHIPFGLSAQVEPHVKMPGRISRIVPRMCLTPRGRARAELSQARIRIPSNPLQGLREIAITLFSFARIFGGFRDAAKRFLRKRPTLLVPVCQEGRQAPLSPPRQTGVHDMSAK
jgi:hypothetical protein